MTIRRWNDGDSVDRLTELLHAAYAEWGEAGVYFWAVEQSSDDTRERLEGGVTWLAVEGEEWVGTVTLYPGTRADIPYYGRPGLWYFGQFGVLPTYKGRGVGRALFDTVVAHAAGAGGLELACDTNSKALRLIGMYEAWGLSQVGHHTWPNGGVSIVLARSLV
ncbi:MAG: GNAT family N-acetyltransferase [Armatimonadetes bacterium]|nr:GNAT family N-acetyltransferase [Armatimonadota bacterium]